MAYDNGSSSGEDSNKTPYDLRQIYAKLVGFHLQDVYNAKQSGNFYKWFEALEDLYTVTQFKYDDDDKSIDLYDAERNKVVSLANKYSAAWTGKSNDPAQINEIKRTLRDLQMWILNKMQDGKIFGVGYEYDEDEI